MRVRYAPFFIFSRGVGILPVAAEGKRRVPMTPFLERLRDPAPTCRARDPKPETCTHARRLSSEGETERVAGRLVEPLNLDKVIFLFCTAQQVDFGEVVDKLHLVMVKSQTLVKVINRHRTTRHTHGRTIFFFCVRMFHSDTLMTWTLSRRCSRPR